MSEHLPFIQADGEGPQPAKIMIVGEALGEQERRDGRPFVGPTGNILNSMLAEAGITREKCYVTNLVKFQPPKNNFNTMYEDGAKRKVPKDELVKQVAYLRQEIIDTNPNIIITVGNEPTKWLTTFDKITKFAGSLLPCSLEPGYKVLPIVHPSFMLHGKWVPWRTATPVHLKRARKHSVERALHVPQREYIYGRAFDEFVDELEKFQHSEKLSVDIETNGNTLTCIGFGDSAYRAVCVPLVHGFDHYFTVEEEAHIFKLIAKLLESEDIIKIMQGGYFDKMMLARQHGIICGGPLHDSMYMHHEIYAETPKALDFLTALYTEEPYFKFERKLEDQTAKWIYNCKDVAVTFEIADMLERDLKEDGLWDNYVETISFLDPLMAMGLYGVNFDQQTQRLLSQKYGKIALDKERALMKLADKAINVNSPKQMQELLYEDFGLPKQYKMDRGQRKVTTELKACLKLRRKAKPVHAEVLDLVIGIRRAKKMNSTYLQPTEKTGMSVDPIDKRMRCDYNVAGTKTFRLSSSGSIFGGGTNLQNIPKRRDRSGAVRNLFMADTGKALGAADLSQAEARVVSYLCGDEVSIQGYANGLDVHTEYAAAIAYILERISKEDFLRMKKDNPEEFKKWRDLGKQVKHATNYDGSYNVLVESCMTEMEMYLSAAEAKELLAAGQEINQQLKGWHRSIRAELDDKKPLITPLNKIRWFGGQRGVPKTYKEAYAFIPQSTVGHLTLKGMLRIYQELGDEVDLLLQVHDEVVFQFPEDKPALALAARELMEEDIPISGRTLMIPSELSVGYRWGSLEEIKTNTVDEIVEVLDERKGLIETIHQ